MLQPKKFIGSDSNSNKNNNKRWQAYNQRKKHRIATIERKTSPSLTKNHKKTSTSAHKQKATEPLFCYASAAYNLQFSMENEMALYSSFQLEMSHRCNCAVCYSYLNDSAGFVSIITQRVPRTELLIFYDNLIDSSVSLFV